ncbi:MAG TPA: radical SAM family heme chaperone HemW [Thermodesulfovibrionales bacterium]|jgi:oxygen-independent coproporphyrinogen-3 oxidase|nr:radical SAM family heme chaperone HemW [Thermodesulfovibrionales bacterium]
MTNALYIHVPFCVKKCIYCDFLSVPYDEDLALEYIAAVSRELDLRKERVGELRTIYIGGGTPTTLPAPALARLLRKIQESFRIAPHAEVTIEANPGTIDEEKIGALCDAGINRLSVGAQAFNDRDLRLLGRIHSGEDVINALGAARYSKVGNISIDLIYGIPGQTMEGWSHAIATAVELSPEHISAYELTPEKGTPLHGLIEQGRLKKPDEETIIDMYCLAIDAFCNAGFGHYEISNFARPGFECRHNLNYWDRGHYLGVGPGAHSFIGGRRTRNTADIGKYLETLARDDLAIEEDVEISCEEAIKEYIFLGLRKTEGLNIREFGENLGIDIVTASEPLVRDGLLLSDGSHVRLTRRGIVLSNTVITELFERLELQ